MTVLALLEASGPLALLMPPADSEDPKGEGLRLAAEAKTSSKGTFTIEGLAPGTYRVMAYAFERPPLARAELIEVTVLAGQRKLNVEVGLSER